MDLFQYGTQGKKNYVEMIAALNPSLGVSWVGRSDVDNRAPCFAKPQSGVDFRYLEKASSQFWSNLVSNERRTGSTTGLVVPYQSVMQNNISSTKKMIV